jgi:hypothetical protein
LDTISVKVEKDGQEDIPKNHEEGLEKPLGIDPVRGIIGQCPKNIEGS